MGPRQLCSRVLTPIEEAMIVAFRRRTLLPLDDVMGCLRDQIPKLTRDRACTAVSNATASPACQPMKR
jgi:hypothetical protein